MVHVGCWAHARRKFDEANKAQGRGKKPVGRAMQGLAYIQKLYRIERSLKEATPQERYLARQEQANRCWINCVPGWTNRCYKCRHNRWWARR